MLRTNPAVKIAALWFLAAYGVVTLTSSWAHGLIHDSITVHRSSDVEAPGCCLSSSDQDCILCSSALLKAAVLDPGEQADVIPSAAYVQHKALAIFLVGALSHRAPRGPPAFA